MAALKMKHSTRQVWIVRHLLMLLTYLVAGVGNVEGHFQKRDHEEFLDEDPPVMKDKIRVSRPSNNNNNNTKDEEEPIVVCHELKTGGVYERIEIHSSHPANDPHIRHGDASPGDLVPDMFCHIFDLHCHAVSLIGTPIEGMSCAIYNSDCTPFLMTGRPIDGEVCSFYDDSCNIVNAVGMHVPGKVGIVYNETCGEVPCEGRPIPFMDGYFYDNDCNPISGKIAQIDAIAAKVNSCQAVECPCWTNDTLNVFTVENTDAASCDATDWPDSAIIFHQGAYYEIQIDDGQGTCITSNNDDGSLSSLLETIVSASQADSCMNLIANKCDLLSKPIVAQCPCFSSEMLEASITRDNFDTNRSCSVEGYPQRATIWQINTKHSLSLESIGFGGYRAGISKATCLKNGNDIEVITDAEAVTCISLVEEHCRSLGYGMNTDC